MSSKSEISSSLVPPALDFIEWKISRAREISNHLDALFGEFSKDDPYAIGSKVDRKKRLCLVLQDIKPLPPYYSLLLSEAIHHLRSSLDHMAWVLSKPSTRKEDRRIGFPICSTSKNFRETNSSKLKGAPSQFISFVESVQPYHRRRWPETRYLGFLQALNNWDKHSGLVASVAAIQGSNIQIRITGKTSIADRVDITGPMQDKKVILRLLPGQSEVGARIEIESINLSIYPAFHKSLPKEVRDKGVRDTLNGAGAFIQESVLPKFKELI